MKDAFLEERKNQKEAGVNIKVIQDALGHADVSTTLGIYADVTKDLRKDEFADLDAYFKKEKKDTSSF